MFHFLAYYGGAEHDVLQEIYYTNYYHYYQYLTAEIKMVQRITLKLNSAH